MVIPPTDENVSDADLQFLNGLKDRCEELKIDQLKIGNVNLWDGNGEPISIEPECAYESFQTMIENMILRTDRKCATNVHIALREYLANYLRTDEMPVDFECSDATWNLMCHESREIFQNQIKFAHVLLETFQDLNGDSFLGRSFDTFRFYIQAIYAKNQNRLPREM